MYHIRNMREAFDDLPPLEEGEAEFKGCFSNFCGTYIGNVETAEMLKSKGIFPTCCKHGDHVCSIGFNHREQKWYGWSHRAMFGFGIGSKISKGDCAYVPSDLEDFIEESMAFWQTPGYLGLHVSAQDVDEQGMEYVEFAWTYSSDPSLIPNTKLHGTQGSVRSYLPDKWGRGEWFAKTLEDARQMACDFAEGVS